MKDNKSKSKKGLRKNKYSHLYKTHKLTERDYQIGILNAYFTDNEEFLPIINVIYKRFEKFFNTLHKLSRHKKELMIKKETLKILFIIDISSRVKNIYYLKNGFQTHDDSEEQLKNTNELTEDSKENQELIVSKALALNIIEVVVENVFAMPEIVLTAFESTSNNYEVTINDLLNKNRTYGIELFKKAKKIYEDNRGKKPRITQAEALIKANNELHIYENENLRNSDGFDTEFFSNMQVSFRRQFKQL